MKTIQLSLPQLGLMVGTRAMLGAGLGLLAAEKMNPERRRGVGWTLATVGALTTVPLLLELWNSPTLPGKPVEESDDLLPGTGQPGMDVA